MNKIKVMNSDIDYHGIFEAKLIEDEGKVRAYIAGVSTLNPFTSDGKLIENIYENNKREFPIVQWCCYNTNSKEFSNKDDVSWVMFENGDKNKPVVLSYVVIGGGSGDSDDNTTPQTGSIDIDNEIVQALFKASLENGYTAAAACGIIANVEVESFGWVYDHGNGQGVHDGDGPSYGLCQWHNKGGFDSEGRFTDLRTYCGQNNLNYRTYEAQIKFLFHELENSEKESGDILKNASNNAEGAYQAGYDFCFHFERPLKKIEQSVARGNSARDNYWPYVKDDKLEK